MEPGRRLSQLHAVGALKENTIPLFDFPAQKLLHLLQISHKLYGGIASLFQDSPADFPGQISKEHHPVYGVGRDVVADFPVKADLLRPQFLHIRQDGDFPGPRF